MREELRAQRLRTDEQRPRAVAFLSELAAQADATEIKGGVAKAQAAIAAQEERRRETDRLAIAPSGSTACFTDMINELLTVAGDVARTSKNGEVAGAISAYVSFMLGKDRAGQERATGALGISAGKFDIETYTHVLGLAARQATYFDAFEAAATADQRRFFKETVAGPAADAVASLFRRVRLRRVRLRDSCITIP